MKKEVKEKIKDIAKKAIMFVINPRLLICVGIAWLITNGWSYIMLALGSYFKIGWMIAVASGYLTFLWLPISPEKIVTVAIAIVLLRFLFPRDEKTLGILRDMHEKLKRAASVKKQEKARKKAEKDGKENT